MPAWVYCKPESAARWLGPWHDAATQRIRSREKSTSGLPHTWGHSGTEACQTSLAPVDAAGVRSGHAAPPREGSVRLPPMRAIPDPCACLLAMAFSDLGAS
jgi:hypothetical protein